MPSWRGGGWIADGDHPSGAVPLQIDNPSASGAINFLFRMRHDLGTTSTLVAQGPAADGGTRTEIVAHLNWHAIWHNEVRWNGSEAQPHITSVHNQIDFGPSTPGAPPDAAIADLIRSPTGRMFNEQANDAIVRFIRRDAAVRVPSADRPASLPADFFT